MYHSEYFELARSMPSNKVAFNVPSLYVSLLCLPAESRSDQTSDFIKELYK
jgi:hypothetical protein